MTKHHKHPAPPETGPFAISEGEPAAQAFDAIWMERGEKGRVALLRDAHPDFHCAQCLYSTAAEWFYLGWKAAGK